MIISNKTEAENHEFESLLNKTQCLMQRWAKKDEPHFKGITSDRFEEDVFESLKTTSKGTTFANHIDLVRGHKFPDIVARNYFGVEVKVSKQNHWKTTGNSVLETTRVSNIQRIYLFFGKTFAPVQFKFRKYEECMSDIAVTHSPRYLVDMDLQPQDTIFKKLGIEYDALRTLKNPIREVVKYFRKNARPGEEPWWMEGAGDEEGNIYTQNVRLWRNLENTRQDEIRIEAMALFPEVFGNSGNKYQNVVVWLAARHGVVNSSLRDIFTAGGQEELVINNKKYRKIPKIFYHLQANAKQAIKIVKNLESNDIERYWGIVKKDQERSILDIWTERVLKYSHASLIKANVAKPEAFIAHLLGGEFEREETPSYLMREMTKHRLD